MFFNVYGIKNLGFAFEAENEEVASELFIKRFGIKPSYINGRKVLGQCFYCSSIIFEDEEHSNIDGKLKCNLCDMLEK